MRGCGLVDLCRTEPDTPVRPSTAELVLDTCRDNYYSININMGERQRSSDLQLHNNIVKFVLRHFKSVTVHLVGQVYKVKQNICTRV